MTLMEKSVLFVKRLLRRSESLLKIMDRLHVDKMRYTACMEATSHRGTVNCNCGTNRLSDVVLICSTFMQSPSGNCTVSSMN